MSVLYFSDHQCILCSVWRQSGCFEAASLEDVDMKSCFTDSQLRCRAARQVDDLMARQRRSVPRPCRVDRRRICNVMPKQPIRAHTSPSASAPTED